MIADAVIYNAIQEDDNIDQLVKSNTYTLLVPAKVEYPYVIIGSELQSVEYAKNQSVSDIVKFEITIWMSNYSELSEIVSDIRNLFERKTIEINGEVLTNINLLGINPDVDIPSNGFSATLSFSGRHLYI